MQRQQLRVEGGCLGWFYLVIRSIHRSWNPWRWWHLGHYGVSERNPTELYMDEHAVRIRAGILNILSWVVVIHVLFLQNQTGIKIIFPLVAYEFFISSLTGLTPLAPLGTVATLISLVLQPKPLWKPANPKRFAWLVGLMLAIACYAVFSNRTKLGKAYEPAMLPIVFMCSFFTWLESACGFCVGCWMYSTFLVPCFGWKQCQECGEK